MDREAFDQRFAGTAVHRIGLDRMLRNAAVAAGNSGDATLLAPLRAAIQRLHGEGAAPVAVEHMEWAVLRLESLAEVVEEGGVA